MEVFSFLLLALACMLTLTQGSNKSNKKPPHILFVLVDDLGWGDVGFHNAQQHDPEIITPTMDRLAAREGIILNRHYVHSSCTGTRTSLQSGRLPVHVQTSLKNPEHPSSGMPRNMTGLAEHLQPRYRTHYVGKWDVGMATPKHTPYGRGYETSLHYFEHKNDYWTQACMQSACCHNYHEETSGAHNNNPFDKWEGPTPKKFYNLSLTDLWDTHRPATHLNGSDYEEYIFLKRMKEIIHNHDDTDDNNKPLFLFYAPHVAHCPLQVPQEYLDKLDFVQQDSHQCAAQTNPQHIVAPGQPQPKVVSCRKQYRAMVTLLDDMMAELVHALKTNNMWDNTLVIFTSDNGGPIRLDESGSTNFDLRGGKYSDWEGGVRATAFVSGGYLPEKRRGLVIDQPIHITDWYRTLPSIAGIDHLDLTGEEGNDFPPVDALDVSSLLLGQTDVSPRQEIPLSAHTIIQGEYKLILQDLVPASGWTGPQYPNASSSDADMDLSLNCSQGCLFNVEEDRGEHEDVASTNPIKVQSMKHRLNELKQGFFQNDDVGQDSCPPDIDMPCACWMAVNHYGGFLGPYQEVES